MRTKRELRLWGLEQMRAITKEVLEEKSRQIVLNLKALPEFQSAQRIFTCLSYNNEVDTWRLIDEILSDPQREVYVPRSHPQDVNLHVHRFPCELETLRIGLRQPTPHEPEIPLQQVNGLLDVALILGVLFDRNKGYRLGYGKGFFDRFLADKSFSTIALAFEQQLVEELPVEPYDLPLHIIVTEKRFYRYGVNERFPERGRTGNAT